MKTTQVLIIGCAIVLGFGIHAFMNRYEHKTFIGNERFPIYSSKLNKITGEMKYYAVLPLNARRKAKELKSFIYQIDVGEITEE